MRKLTYQIDLSHFKEIKDYIVPTIFTEHQFHLIEKKFTNKNLTPSERNEFSRAISKKMKALDKINKKENIFIYGKEKILPERLDMAKTYLNELKRRFKGTIIISGSFLYNKTYKDIDVFILSKYDKEDYKEKDFHISYLTQENSLFFNSLKKLCISNSNLENLEIKDNINLDTFISIYQELFNDLEKNVEGKRSTLREFLLQAAYTGKQPIPDSYDLNHQSQAILAIKNPKKAIKNIFINAIILGIEKKQAIKEMNKMITAYKDISVEYSQHKRYYQDLISSFKEVISIES